MHEPVCPKVLVCLLLNQHVGEMEYGLQREISRSALTDGEKTSYISSTLCLMDAAQAPAKTGYAGSTTVWEELQAAHVSQAQFIHSVVSQAHRSNCIKSIKRSLIQSPSSGGVPAVAPLVHDCPGDPSPQ